MFAKHWTVYFGRYYAKELDETAQNYLWLTEVETVSAAVYQVQWHLSRDACGSWMSKHGNATHTEGGELIPSKATGSPGRRSQTPPGLQEITTSPS